MPLDTDPNWYESHPISETLLRAPPGCGKTEGIARWLAMLVQSGELESPRRVLALTFSNKAKANLRSRLREQLGLGWWRYVTVTNFHGWAFHVYQHHCSCIGREPLKIAPQRGWEKALVSAVCADYGCDTEALNHALRACKVGVFDDDRVLENLDSYGLAAAIEYERRLRTDERVDFDDLIRLGLLVLQDERVRSMYDERFSVVVVDEVQDLSLGHFGLVAKVGLGKTLWAGDAAQGIYGFAGAQPAEVLAEILDRDPVQLELTASFRSSANVLRAVSALSVALGGHEVQAVEPDAWGDGRLLALRSNHVLQEAEWIVGTVAEWLTQQPNASVAVIARTAGRRKWVDQEVRRSGIEAEIWDYPAHKPTIVELLHLRFAEVDTSLPSEEAVEDLYLRCFVDLDPLDLDSLDELIEVFDTIRELTHELELAEVVSGIRVASSADDPVGPGLHLLNGHVGKGQQFDRVIVLGLEEAFLPHYFAIKSGRPEDIEAELAVLHVMASRAREQLVVCTCHLVPKWNGEDLRRDQSRWFGLIEGVADEVVRL